MAKEGYRQVNLRQKIVLNFSDKDKTTYGFEKTDPSVVTLPAGLVDIPEALCDHWMVKGAIEEGKRPMMGGPRLEERKPIDPSQTTLQPANPAKEDDNNKGPDPVVILSDEELAPKTDDELRDYLRTAGNQAVAKDAPREKVLERIAKLRPKEA